MNTSGNSNFGNPGGFRRGGNNPRFPRRPENPDAHRINHRITAREVRVITDAGEQLGVLSLRDALVAAEQAGLDLVEVAPTAQPPVCKIMDYGKFKYKEAKKEAEARKNRTENTTKEIRLSYRTDVGDLDIKVKQARGFIADGDKVKFSMRFKGREVMHMGLGQEKFNSIAERMSDIAIIDERSSLSGRQMHIVFAPSRSGVKKDDQKPLTQKISLTAKGTVVKETAVKSAPPKAEPTAK